MTAFEGLTVGTYTIDPTHTEISFSVRHLAISSALGTSRLSALFARASR